MQKCLMPVIKSQRSPPDVLEEYRAVFGYLGQTLHSAVVKARLSQAPINPTPSPFGPPRPTLTISQVIITDINLISS